MSSQPNINIYSENVEVIYTASKDGGYSVDIKDKDNVGTVPLSATTYSSLNTEENKNSCISYRKFGNLQYSFKF